MADNFQHLRKADPGHVILIEPEVGDDGEPKFAGLTAILYVLAVALDVDNAEQIATVFSDRLRTKTIVTPIKASYLADIVREAREV